MMKHLGSRYHGSRVAGGTATSATADGGAGAGWWKWKIDPFTVDAVLIAAQQGSGNRAGLFTDYTFGVWDPDSSGRLTPFAKAYSGLTRVEIAKVDAFIRSHITARAGPVRMVEPELVFEIGFEGIQESTRHKSGIAVRFPRMLRWRQDKKAKDADTIQMVRGLLEETKRRDRL
jgi:DNA ligase-1